MKLTNLNYENIIKLYNLQFFKKQTNILKKKKKFHRFFLIFDLETMKKNLDDDFDYKFKIVLIGERIKILKILLY